MQSLRTCLATVGAGLAAAAIATFALAPPAAAAGYQVTTDPVSAAAGWLSTQFVDGSHLPTPNGDHFDQKYGKDYFPNQGVNADVIFGLAAAKTAAGSIDKALQYLDTFADAYADLSGSQGGPYDGAVGKLALAAIVAGDDPTDFGGSNLMATLAKDECPAASTTCTPGAAANIFSSVSESFVILAEARTAGKKYTPSTDALAYLVSLQCGSGGFTDGVTACGSGPADLDATSYALMALSAAGGHRTEIRAAVGWLKGQQESAGYWISQDIPNANSTGLAAAALAGEGEDVSTARTWLRSQQVGAGAPGAGAVKYDGKMTPATTAATSPSVLATAQALIGLVEGGSLATVTARGAATAQSLFAPSATASTDTVQTGSKQSARGVGFVAGEQVEISIQSDPVTVATPKTDAAGVVSATYTIPTSVAAGAHELVLTGSTSGLSVALDLRVTAKSTAGSPAGGSSSVPAGQGVTGGSQSAGTVDPIAATGLDGSQVRVMTLAGALSVLVGVAFVGAGRRRERT